MPHVRVSAVVMTLTTASIGPSYFHTCWKLTSNWLALHLRWLAIASCCWPSALPSTSTTANNDIVKRVTDAADHYDDALVAQFGGFRGDR